MNPKFILFPVFGMFVLMSAVLLRLAYLRFTAVRNKTVSLKFFRTGQGEGETPAMYYTSRNFVNLFEAPVLFYVVCILFYVIARFDNADVARDTVGLAWAYVGLRVIHSAIHLTINDMNWRFGAYALSQAVLLMLWLGLFLKLV